MEVTPNTELDTLKAKYYAACHRVEHGNLLGRHLAWQICLARGYRKFISDYAMRTGDEDAMNLVLGAPHWITYNDGTLQGLCHAA